jgi:hypothetical protein
VLGEEPWEVTARGIMDYKLCCGCMLEGRRRKRKGGEGAKPGVSEGGMRRRRAGFIYITAKKRDSQCWWEESTWAGRETEETRGEKASR